MRLCTLDSPGTSCLRRQHQAPSVHIDRRVENGNYDATGTVVIGYTLFELTLALALGVAFHVVYQLESHFWPLQLTETGLFIGLAAVLVLLAAWWTRRRAL